MARGRRRHGDAVCGCGWSLHGQPERKANRLRRAGRWHGAWRARRVPVPRRSERLQSLKNRHHPIALRADGPLGDEVLSGDTLAVATKTAAAGPHKWLIHDEVVHLREWASSVIHPLPAPTL